MVESLLEYSRVSTHGAPLEPTNVEIVLEGVLDDLRLRIDETDATITADDMPIVRGDGDQLAHVFRNLLSNALEYSGNESPQIHVGVDRTDDGWQFSVDDECIGIDPAYHDRIFNVFETLSIGNKPPESSTGGIGLALCERIVERHGGDIWVESDTGDGATFRFTVPTIDARQPIADAPPRETGSESDVRSSVR